MQTFVNADRIQSVDFNHEVVAEEYEADNREEIDEYDSEHGRQQNRSAVLRYRSDHIQQRFLAVDYVQ